MAGLGQVVRNAGFIASLEAIGLRISIGIESFSLAFESYRGFGHQSILFFDEDIDTDSSVHTLQPGPLDGPVFNLSFARFTRRY